MAMLFRTWCEWSVFFVASLMALALGGLAAYAVARGSDAQVGMVIGLGAGSFGLAICALERPTKGRRGGLR